MDRQIIYPGQVPMETDLLLTNKNTMTAIAKLCAAILGVATCVSGFATSQTVVPSLAVLVGPGDIYSLQNIDGTAYSSLPSDTAHSIVKQGISLDPVTLPITPPATAGFSINYLIQVGYQDSDTGSAVLPYYNASNPAIAYSGPANSGAAQPTKRAGIVSIQAKAGIAATTGTQTTPAPDAGYTGLYVVTVANGASTVVNANISALSTAPFINSTLHGLLPTFSTPVVVGAATASNHAVQLSQVASAYQTRGLAAANNGSVPNTQFDFRADMVGFRNPATGALAAVANVPITTNNILAGGPVANGRDQAGAFAPSSWVHFYFIYNGTTVATVSSASAPLTGPTLPAGYTSWAYIGAVYHSSGSALANGYFRGSWFTYRTPVVVVSGGTATLRTAVSLAAAVPPNAPMVRPRVAFIGVTSNGVGTYLATVTLEVVTAFEAYVFGIGGTGGTSLNFFGYGGGTLVPNVGQSMNYFITLTSGSGPSTNIVIDGYSNPNGGE